MLAPCHHHHHLYYYYSYCCCCCCCYYYCYYYYYCSVAVVETPRGALFLFPLLMVLSQKGTSMVVATAK